VYLPLPELEIDVIVGDHTGEALGDTPELQQWRIGHRLEA
jgi:hypothetical protein